MINKTTNIFVKLIFVFACGYIANDLSNSFGILFTNSVNAEAVGMAYYDLISNLDFKIAVQYIVEDCSIDISITGEYADVSC